MHNSKLRSLLIVCGPTAMGKTGLALELAGKFDGELVSCDSRQVYKYMDVVTGKDLPEGFRLEDKGYSFPLLGINTYTDGKINIWGYDLVRPDGEFSVQMYLKFVGLVLSDIWKRGKLPIIVGGTGFYVQSLLSPPKTINMPMNSELRRELNVKSVEELLERLKQLDPERVELMNESDVKNPRRLIRAIEVADYKLGSNSLGAKVSRQTPPTPSPSTSSGQVSSEEGELLLHLDGVTEILVIGLKLERKRLYERIDARVDERMANEKLVDELEWLLENNYLSKSPSTTIGYQQLIEWMGGLCFFEEVVQRWKFAEHGYARRQLTWFKKMKEIDWFDIDEKGWKERVVENVEKWTK